MTKIDPITLARRRFLQPGVSADDYASAVLELNTTIGDDVLAASDLEKGTEVRARLAKQDTPLAFEAISRIVASVTRTEEQRENLVFLLAKAIDDSLNLGAFYMAGRSKEDLPRQITAADMARKGGSAKRAHVEKWREMALPLARAIRSEHPECSDSDLIRDLLIRYGATRPVLPGSRQLQTWISRLVRDDQLMPSQKANELRRREVKRSTSDGERLTS